MLYELDRVVRKFAQQSSNAKPPLSGLHKDLGRTLKPGIWSDHSDVKNSPLLSEVFYMLAPNPNA